MSRPVTEQRTPAPTRTQGAMRPNDVHVWSLRLDLSPVVRDRLASLLSADERARAQRFARAADRSRYVCAHGLLRLILAGYLGAPPEKVAFDTGSGGKPQLRNRPSLHFNLAHAGALGLVAVSAEREVGVDVERVHEVGAVRDLAQTCFSCIEQDTLAAVAEPLRLRAFFAGWTRKEAFLKLVGAGLARPLASFDVTLAPGEPVRLLRVRGEPAADYALCALRPAPGYVGAVAAMGKDITICWQPWQMLAVLVDEFVGTERPAVRLADDVVGWGSGRAGDGARGHPAGLMAQDAHAVPIGEREP